MFSALVVCIALLAIVANGFITRNVMHKQQTSLSMATENADPLLLRAARGEKVESVPVWMMRQAGRHMQVR